MKTEVLQEVLTEILEETKLIRQEQQFIIKVLEKQAEELNYLSNQKNENTTIGLEEAVNLLNENSAKFYNSILEKLKQHFKAESSMHQQFQSLTMYHIRPLKRVMYVTIGALIATIGLLLIIFLA